MSIGLVASDAETEAAAAIDGPQQTVGQSMSSVKCVCRAERYTRQWSRLLQYSFCGTCELDKATAVSSFTALRECSADIHES